VRQNIHFIVQFAKRINSTNLYFCEKNSKTFLNLLKDLTTKIFLKNLESALLVIQVWILNKHNKFQRIFGGVETDPSPPEKNPGTRKFLPEKRPT
jgi:hypothetical protein